MPQINPNPLNYHQTHRILLLVDLSPPLLRLQNPNSYLDSVVSSAETLLSFSPLSASLSSVKFFFSSLSPLISSSTLRNVLPCNSVSFDYSDQTLASLKKTIELIRGLGRVSGVGSVSKVSFTSSSVAQVIHDYAWDLSGNDDDVSDDIVAGVVRSNLVVLFSPICRSFSGLCEYMEDGEMINKRDDNDVFSDKFRSFFGPVRDAFVSRDIHFSWVDVTYELGCDTDSESCKFGDEYGRLLELFRNGVNGLGWGFCSSGSIVFGSAVVSFGLIYPLIGVSSSDYRDVGDDKHKKILGHLNLEILDVNGKPLECKYCDLEIVDPNMVRGRKLNELSMSWESGTDGREIFHQNIGIRERFGHGVVKIDVKALCRYNDLVKFEEQSFEVVLVQESSFKSKKNKEDSSRQFFTDRVLDLLSAESPKSVRVKSPPLWQILLSFLYRRGYWALVSLSNADGSTTISILKPFTVHSALLCIPKKDADFQYSAQFDLNSLTLGPCSSETADKSSGLDGGVVSISGVKANDGRGKHKKHSYKYKVLSWLSFCKAAFEHCEMELEEACFSGGYESKKLKFLKCWMKQIVKNSSSFRCKLNLLQTRENSDDRLCESQRESELPLALPVGVHELPQTEEGTSSLPEAEEAFFNNLSQRIQHGIESGVGLLAFAQRIVHSCIYWLSRKLGSHTNEEGEASIETSNCSSYQGNLLREVIKILLIEPKDVAGKHKETDLSSKASDSNSSENKIRQYELQILFRMEILQSELAGGIRDSTKHKFVKQICSLLEFIQCSMDDGFFGDFNLSDYVGRIIGARYQQNLAGVVHRIYEQMDLLLFDDEDESPNLLLNSEESNQSWRIGDKERGSEPNSTEDSISGPSRDYQQIKRETDHERKLVEAQERRQRASRLSSFNRRAMPELQRVWAPKPQKLSRSKSESFRRSKRKSRKESYDTVCETPMSGAKKCLFPSECSIGDQDTSSPGLTKRALFQDDTFQHDW
ncbi:hypothetical protein vseg_001298 [Gypsophila vaccaria]